MAIPNFVVPYPRSRIKKQDLPSQETKPVSYIFEFAHIATSYIGQREQTEMIE